MYQLSDKKLIIVLIKDLLIFTKLTNGLTRIGWEADEYYLNLAETIFQLMHFKENNHTEKIFEEFLNGLARVDIIDIRSSHTELEHLTETIYCELQSKKPR